MDDTITLTEKQEDLLRTIYEHGGQVASYSRLADLQDKGRSAVYKLVQRIDDRLLNTVEGANGTIIELTDSGHSIAEDLDPHGAGHGNTEDMERLHGLLVTARIKGDLAENWQAILQEREDVDFVKSEGNDWITYRDIWVHRFHKDSVTLQLRDGCSIQAGTADEAFRELWQKIREAGEWIEDVVGAPLDYSRVRLGHAELAFEDHHLAQLAVNLPGLDESKISVEDPDLDKKVLGIDASKGPELEAFSGERAEEIGRTVEDEMRQFLNPKLINTRHQLEGELVTRGINGQEAARKISQVDVVQDQLQETEEELEVLGSEIEDMKQRQDHLLELKKEERKTREQARELRNTVAQSVLEHEDKLEDLEEQVGQIQVVQQLVEKVDELENKVSEVAGSRRQPPASEVVEPDRQRPEPPETARDVTLTSIEVKTQEDEVPEFMADYEDLNVDPAKLEQGQKFKDLRDDKLLEIQKFMTRETAQGYQDVAIVRICGTLKTWNEVPRLELARLLGTGRFELVETPL